jgi:hypothetical protein
MSLRQLKPYTATTRFQSYVKYSIKNAHAKLVRTTCSRSGST